MSEENLFQCYMFLYALWAVIVSVIDAVVCGDIFYTVTVYDTYHSYVQQLYSLEGMDYNLSHWLQVYGATSVTKLAVYPAIVINPPLILVIGSYLYATGKDLDTRLGQACHGSVSIDNTVSNITCQMFNNPVQYQQLELLNEIQLFGSIIVVGIIPLCAICFFGWIFGVNLLKYTRDVIIRTNNLLCCRCYKRFCEKCSYIFCYGPEPTIDTTPFKSTSQNLAQI